VLSRLPILDHKIHTFREIAASGDAAYEDRRIKDAGNKCRRINDAANKH